MIRPPRTAPCRGYPVPLLFPDVEPDVLAREAACEQGNDPPTPGPWPAYLQRTLAMADQDAAD